ncbi:hypothetical protein FVE85_7710 [Porphyridium purpureum]|uniref:Uncharacterized protein n=1 Tax=Porphyridium purpureum TaxID=35688 RepID=A0A5J4YIS6_PORPP|nr:hypothetical protein FVE85_7710 [Porphyridium purpureum]|eukprot:POR5084..scf210_14
MSDESTAKRARKGLAPDARHPGSPVQGGGAGSDVPAGRQPVKLAHSHGASASGAPTVNGANGTKGAYASAGVEDGASQPPRVEVCAHTRPGSLRRVVDQKGRDYLRKKIEEANGDAAKIERELEAFRAANKFDRLRTPLLVFTESVHSKRWEIHAQVYDRLVQELQKYALACDLRDIHLLRSVLDDTLDLLNVPHLGIIPVTLMKRLVELDNLESIEASDSGSPNPYAKVFDVLEKMPYGFMDTWDETLRVRVYEKIPVVFQDLIERTLARVVERGIAHDENDVDEEAPESYFARYYPFGLFPFVLSEYCMGVPDADPDLEELGRLMSKSNVLAHEFVSLCAQKFEEEKDAVYSYFLFDGMRHLNAFQRRMPGALALETLCECVELLDDLGTVQSDDIHDSITVLFQKLAALASDSSVDELERSGIFVMLASIQAVTALARGCVEIMYHGITGIGQDGRYSMAVHVLLQENADENEPPLHKEFRVDLERIWKLNNLAACAWKLATAFESVSQVDLFEQNPKHGLGPILSLIAEHVEQANALATWSVKRELADAIESWIRGSGESASIVVPNARVLVTYACRLYQGVSVDDVQLPRIQLRCLQPSFLALFDLQVPIVEDFAPFVSKLTSEVGVSREVSLARLLFTASAESI